MPFINVKTNRTLTRETIETIKSQLGTAITAVPGKSESWLMVAVEESATLFFQGNDAPAAMVQVSLYGNATSGALNTLTSRITDILSTEASIPANRVYVSYMTTSDWGWNGNNF